MMQTQLYEKLKPFLWVPVTGPFNAVAAGAFRWSAPHDGPPAYRHPTPAEFARYYASFGDCGQHYERDTVAAHHYLARHRKVAP
jgi:hypothetical protein